jgi:hypothetical protein
VMSTFEVRPGLKTAAAWAGQRVSAIAELASRRLGRGKGVNALMHLEGLLIGTEGRLGLWETLDALQESEPALRRFEFTFLIERTLAHRMELERHRLALSLHVFAQRQLAEAAEQESMAQLH